jgi:hypothetical protein
MRRSTALLLLSTSLFGGCGFGSPGNWELPKDSMLMAETNSRASDRRTDPSFGSFQVADRSTLYIYDNDVKRLIYTGTVMPGQTVRLYPGGAAILPQGTTAPTKSVEEYLVAQYPPGEHVSAYLRMPGETSKP